MKGMSRRNLVLLAAVSAGLWIAVRAPDYHAQAPASWGPFVMWTLWFAGGCLALGWALACFVWAPNRLKPPWLGAVVGIGAVAAATWGFAASKGILFAQPEFQSSGYSGIQALVIGGVLSQAFSVRNEVPAE